MDNDDDNTNGGNNNYGSNDNSPSAHLGHGVLHDEHIPHSAVIPLVTIIGGAMVGMCVWSGYALVTKTDVQFTITHLARFN
ncbi:hypothetical protein E2C01_022472 [Portunus trituberculatus]|uniref:Uncharacterized protein n=1 Tax=Portunus trituberculatus TaxID=210409 RepID=A0A5B7E7C8_PORTR|nr:hypothetical protein [Portunus trituberculatus]